jgi:hypothetical protein
MTKFDSTNSSRLDDFMPKADPHEQDARKDKQKLVM